MIGNSVSTYLHNFLNALATRPHDKGFYTLQPRYGHIWPIVLEGIVSVMKIEKSIEVPEADEQVDKEDGNELDEDLEHSHDEDDDIDVIAL